MPLENLTSGLKIELEKVYPYNLELVYKFLFDETTDFQLSFMPTVEKNFIEGSQLNIIDSQQLQLDDFNDSQNFFKNVQINKSTSERSRKFTQQISTPVLNKLVTNNETMKVRRHTSGLRTS